MYIYMNIYLYLYMYINICTLNFPLPIDSRELWLIHGQKDCKDVPCILVYFHERHPMLLPVLQSGTFLFSPSRVKRQSPPPSSPTFASPRVYSSTYNDIAINQGVVHKGRPFH